jgi:hypothetical protein
MIIDFLAAKDRLLAASRTDDSQSHAGSPARVDLSQWPRRPLSPADYGRLLAEIHRDRISAERSPG